MPLRATLPNVPVPIYLGHKWFEDSIIEYRQGRCKFASLQGKHIAFAEKDFAAALMHLYVGTFTLDEIANVVSLPSAELPLLRTQIDFMTLVDSLKASFARFFRENLILNEYSPHDYVSIAGEYGALEELARNQIRVPLFKRMKQLADSVSEKERHQLPIDSYDLRSFKKLFSFFVFEERFLQSLAKPSFPELKRIAKEIVWSRLGADYDELASLVCADLTGYDVKDELKTHFESLALHYSFFVTGIWRCRQEDGKTGALL
jgi:hypothetical protein